MAVKPTSPERSDLESKSREDLQAIAKLTGVEVSGRASKATLIETIMGSATPSAASTPASSPAAPARTTRAVRSRRTVATPDDDFESLLNEFTAEADGTPGASHDASATPTSATNATARPRGAPRARTQNEALEATNENCSQ